MDRNLSALDKLPAETAKVLCAASAGQAGMTLASICDLGPPDTGEVVLSLNAPVLAVDFVEDIVAQRVVPSLLASFQS